jgi:hypothetical protein
MKQKLIVICMLLGYFLLIGVPIFADDIQPTSQTVAIDYSFPYPGLLPDNPLYFLKATRDRVVSFFIKDSMKKASFELLQADKRVEAAVLLSKKGSSQTPLVVATFSKGDNYFEEATQSVIKAKSEKKDVASLVGKMQTAAKKYKEVLLTLSGNLSSEKASYKILLDRADTLVEKANAL